jgi:carboxylesterase type B
MLLLHILPLALVIVAQSADGLLVSTQSGPIKGHYVPGKPTVREFLGIPYGAPPVGDLRWAPAIQPPRWNTPLEAKAFSPACYNVVPTGYNLGASPTTVNTPKPLVEDEDCGGLFLVMICDSQCCADEN